MAGSSFRIPKRGKIAKNIDRVSRFPDPILGHILSFLPVKNAVATSILSKRWKSVFLHVHEINLDNFFLNKPKSGEIGLGACTQNTVLNGPNLCQLEVEVGKLVWELPHSHNSLPRFCKLTFLELSGEYYFDMLKLVLHNAPNLERLICNACENVESTGHEDNSRIMQQLKEVEVRNFGGYDDHGGFGSNLKMLVYFLEHGVMLKKMVIVGSYGSDGKFYHEAFQSDDFKRLLLKRSYSSAVEILYRSPC